MAIPCSRICLLTGAGFTHNFGAPLAKGMWSLVFNQAPAAQQNVRAYLMSSEDFEKLYHEVDTSLLSDPEKQAVRTAVERAYEDVDKRLLSGVSRHDGPHLFGVQKLLAMFGKGQGRGFIFTLNQDLFVERCGFNWVRQPSMPGVAPCSEGLFIRGIEAPLGSIQVSIPAQILPAQRDAVSRSGDFHFVKLHGSCNWRSSAKRNAMVIGQGKASQISSEPLLAWYLDLFREHLTGHARKLMVIGYGFKDDHINAIIEKAVTDNGLQLYVVSPQDSFQFTSELRKQSPVMFGAVVRHYECSLKDLFPMQSDGTATSWEDAISKDFFEGEISRGG